ncbi:late competence protein ComER [Parageobacillus thermoglucosidasius]|uniref:Pyrroline-5-carboxylate reductase n=1 Tax=Geobacillus sp. (strain Y4.1MC1) TaxID=581103 RepID=A0A7U3YDL0_GEOS0|nr:late competence protein ComER [Parageobacillus thermoglucosidasius]MED4905080.1 late competence protein ComER [Parageobacillus thermoglucosidasius]MED4913305.1 late competence protein ComER [Parageobacillus thermoglucosidasius]MED4944656.1 late competence protein ComER [Parageobacillus thermoglucosidasius]MED4982411.1 late competence protein ComER [Parageobacillus thermoglucosidasius]RDE20113.1 late competence protein ComER [Parageobacillus thermoglucosidasius]
MKIGMIGTGNMGRILIEAFLESGAVKEDQLIITNRTLEKALDIQRHYPNVYVASGAEEVVQKAIIVFLCVKPLDIHPLLQQLSSFWTKEHCLVSITSPISVQQLEAAVPCHVARVIPSITNRALSGSTLITFGQRCSRHYQTYIEQLFRHISVPSFIDHEITRIASDIASCGPAFFSYLLQRFIEAAVKKTAITKEQATVLTNDMIIGLGELLKSNLYTLPALQEKVCVKGGITGEGIAVLEKEMEGVFERVFAKTHEKFKDDIEKVKKQFNN